MFVFARCAELSNSVKKRNMVFETFAETIQKFNAKQYGDCLKILQARLYDSSDELLFVAMQRFVQQQQQQSTQSVYVKPEGFQSFIRFGGNVQLYENVSKALLHEYRKLSQPFSLVDIGCG